MLDQPRRHLFLSIWLWLVIIANAFVASLYLFAAHSPAVLARMPGVPSWFFLVTGAIGIVNVICAIALLRWKKWGFWGILITAIVVCGLNITVAKQPLLPTLVSSFVGVLILYWALHMGDERKAWPRLH
ncbi:MAG: hypothetical protein P4M14_07985 [Gammaproteobacteria bacterium]|nr:hypothetical protein [Gammaproteobacteria bacterium]